MKRNSSVALLLGVFFASALNSHAVDGVGQIQERVLVKDYEPAIVVGCNSIGTSSCESMIADGNGPLVDILNKTSTGTAAQVVAGSDGISEAVETEYRGENQVLPEFSDEQLGNGGQGKPGSSLATDLFADTQEDLDK